MKTIATLVIFLISSLANAGNEPDWKVEFGWRSGWGMSSVLLINSEGLMQLSKGYPEKDQICKVRLKAELLEKINKKISSIPENLPTGTLIQYIDNCRDERENFIYITENNQMRGFVYSRKSKCWANEVPAWLQSLYGEVNKYKSDIESCDKESIPE